MRYQDDVFHPGQVWAYRTRPGEEESELRILLVEQYSEDNIVVHIAVGGVYLQEPTYTATTPQHIAHLPIQKSALQKSVTLCLRTDEQLPPFYEGYQLWREAFLHGRGGVYTSTVKEAIQYTQDTINSEEKSKQYFFTSTYLDWSQRMGLALQDHLLVMTGVVLAAVTASMVVRTAIPALVVIGLYSIVHAMIAWLKSRNFVHSIELEDHKITLSGYTHDAHWQKSIPLTHAVVEVEADQQRAGARYLRLVIRTPHERFRINTWNNWDNDALYDVFIRVREMKGDMVMVDQQRRS